LSQPEVALEIVRRTRDVVPDHLPVTVKMRRGIDDSEESRDNFFRILDGALAMGVAAITVHGRSVKQRYIGPSRWEFLAEVKRHAGDHVILGSGDLFTAQDCLDMMRQTGVNGVTVARGAISNPWIFAQARAIFAGDALPDPPSTHQQRDVIREHYRLAEELHGDRCGPLMRKFGIKYAALHPDFAAVRQAFVKTNCQADWLAVLARWYAEDRPGQYPSEGLHTAQGSCTP
jgi:tRNA-dihydrouridine synthase